MQPNDLEQAWRQFKLVNALHGIESEEILSIIENAGNANRTTLQKVLFNLLMFIAIAFFCQGG